MKQRSFGWMGLVAIALILSVLISSVWQNGWAITSLDFFEIAQETPESESAVPDLGLALSGTYEDPQGNFQIGILDGYAVSSAAGSPLFQNAEGSIAYSVVWVPLSSETPLSEIGLVEIAQQTLGQGEGFQTQTFNAVPDGGLEISWRGRLSQGADPPRPVSGVVLVQQEGAEAYLLVVAALEDATSQVSEVVSTLTDTLTIL